jgi:hypothetical protein
MPASEATEELLGFICTMVFLLKMAVPVAPLLAPTVIIQLAQLAGVVELFRYINSLVALEIEAV